jgi:hypothetical protein
VVPLRCHAHNKARRSCHSPAVHLLQGITGREVCCYSISCKNQTNIDLVLEWLTKHAKS